MAGFLIPFIFLCMHSQLYIPRSWPDSFCNPYAYTKAQGLSTCDLSDLSGFDFQDRRRCFRHASSFLGGASIVMFGIIAAAGMKLLAQEELKGYNC